MNAHTKVGVFPAKEADSLIVENRKESRDKPSTLRNYTKTGSFTRHRRKYIVLVKNYV